MEPTPTMIDADPVKLIADFTKLVLDEPAPDLFLSHITNQTLSSLDCRGAILGVIKREGFLDLVGTYGYKEDVVQPFARIPLWTPMPISDAARTGELNIFNNTKELIAAYPALAQFENEPNNVTVSAPIKYRGAVIGAVGFTSLKAPQKEFQNSPVTQTILALCGLYVRNLLAARIAEERDYSGAVKTLSTRQKEIISLFEEDLTTEQMADKLRYSASTIKQDIIKIYGVFGVNSRTSVIELARKAGLIKAQKD